ncbi:hypothetical protein PRIPAC_86597 [Pristionchus pacificus]|nr:hypothetical protein PRIPAC_86597 [Pristionchus pacificus]
MWIFGGVIERRKLYFISASTWIVLSLSSILLGSESFLAFVVLRSLSAVASAIVGVLSLVLMADVFCDRALGIALSLMLMSEMMLGKSFVIITIGTSLGTFCMRALAFWMPSGLLSALTYAPEAFMGLSYPSATALNSIISLAGMLLGVPTILWIAQSWHHGSGGLCSRRFGYANAFPIVTGTGLYSFSI